MVNLPPVHGGDIYGYDQTGLIDFSANINPLGMPPSIKQAIAANIDAYACYPDPHCRELKDAIALHEGIGTDSIVCGNGAADLIYRAILCLRPKKALLLAPTFSEYQAALRLCDCEIVYHFLREDQDFFLDSTVLSALTPDVDLVVICNPNNPTGIPADGALMSAIAQRCRDMDIRLMVDECFADFVLSGEIGMVSQLSRLQNVIVLKAFTKMYAMAGIRLGYALCGDSALVKAIEGTLQPWSVSTVASKCGVAALSERDFAARTRRVIAHNRRYLCLALEGLGIRVFPSQVNYLLLRCDRTDLEERLLPYGILIRDCSDYVGLDARYYRIAVKSQPDNQRLIDCLSEILNG